MIDVYYLSMATAGGAWVALRIDLKMMLVQATP
jgi:hypothetical protein